MYTFLCCALFLLKIVEIVKFYQKFYKKGYFVTYIFFLNLCNFSLEIIYNIDGSSLFMLSEGKSYLNG